MFRTFIIVFFLLSTLQIKNIYAQEACGFACPTGTDQSGSFECTNRTNGSKLTPDASCVSGKKPSDPTNPSCVCEPIPAGGPEKKCEAKCPTGTQQIDPTHCAATAAVGSFKPGDKTPLVGTCGPGFSPSDPLNVASCVCKANVPGGPVAPVPVPAPVAINATATTPTITTCKPGDKDCSKAGGTRCDTASGSPSDTGTGILTAIGCVPTKPFDLVTGLLKYGSFASGGVAFLIMILAAIQMITAEGNPESIKKAQEKFYSAIIGLLLIIFSVLLMQVIGVDILGLPGFGKQ